MEVVVIARTAFGLENARTNRLRKYPEVNLDSEGTTPHTARTVATAYARHPSRSSTDEELERRPLLKYEAHHQSATARALPMTTTTPGTVTTNTTSVTTGTSNPEN